MTSFIHPLATPEYQYATILVTNQNDGLMRAEGTFTSTTPILNNPSEYVGRLQRISLSTLGVPLIIPNVLLGQNDPNELVYEFSLGYNNIFSELNSGRVIFVKQNTFFPVPNNGDNPINSQDLSNGYYYIESYASFLAMWNTAITSAFDSLLANLVDPAPEGLEPPVFYYDPTCGIVLKAQKEFYEQLPNSDVTLNKFQLYCNDELLPLINGIKTNAIIGSNEVQLLTRAYNSFNFYDEVVNYDSTGDYYLQKQTSLNDLCYWSSITSFQIRSTMPIVFENSQGAQGSQSTNQAISQYSNVLTDLVIDTSLSPSAFKTLQIFNNTDYFRVFNLTKTNTMYRIDIQIYWLDQYGRSYPLYLLYGQSCSIKFEFIKRSVFQTSQK